MSRHVRTAALTVAAALASFGLAAVPASAQPAAATSNLLPTAHFALADFGVDQHWRVDRHPRLLADITGDGRADIVGFFDDGVHTAIATGDGNFAPSRFVLNDFGFNQGWRIGTHPRFVTDITGDGRADLVGIGNAGVYTAVSNGDGTFGPFQFVLRAFGASTRPPSQLFAADVNGDGRTDLVSISNFRVDVALALGNGGFAAPILASTEFGIPTFDQFRVADVTGDGRAEILAFRTDGPIHIVSASPRADGTYLPSRRAVFDVTSPPQNMDAIADVTGDGRADLVGFGDIDPATGGRDPRTYVAVSHGTGEFDDFKAAVNDFGTGAGYNVNGIPQATLGDITGDHRSDIVGFSANGVVTAVANGDGTFAPSRLVVADFGLNSGGWRTDQHVRLVADITGDGRADVVGFGNAGVYTAVSAGDGTFGGGPVVAVVPDVGGDSQSQATAALQAAGLLVGSVSFVVDDSCNNIGTVSGQNPSAGAQVAPGTAVGLTIGTQPGHPCP